jgi:Domain of unknown function (DUF4209)
MDSNLFSEISSILQEVTPKDVKDYAILLFGLNEKLVEAQRHNDAEVIYILASICNLQFSDDLRQPFGPKDNWIFSRRNELDRLQNKYLPILESILSKTSDFDLRARVLDFVTYLKRDFRSAEDVVSAYMLSVNSLLKDNYENWDLALERINRTIQVASGAGRNHPAFEKLKQELKEVLDEAATKDSLFAVKLIDSCLNYNIFDSSDLGARAEQIAQRLTAASEAERNELWVQWYWQTVVNAFVSRDDTRANKARQEIAHSFEREANQVATHPSIPNLLTSPKLQRALHVWRMIPGMEAERERVHKRLLAVQKNGLKELGSLPITIDQQEAIEVISQGAIDHVKDKPLFEALKCFSFLNTPLSKEILEKEVDRELASPLLRLFPHLQMDSFGRTVAIDPTNEEELRLARTLANLARHQQIISDCLLWPAYQQLLKEHIPTYQDIMPIVMNNPLIREGHELLAATVIIEGLRGHLLQAIHVLLPQLEDSLRFLLEQRDTITSSLKPSGIQEDYTLNVLLEGKFASSLEQLLGPEVVLDLRSLLVNKFGTNLRNEVLHGRVTDNFMLRSPHVLYAWWFYIKLLVVPFMIREGGLTATE